MAWPERPDVPVRVAQWSHITELPFFFAEDYVALLHAGRRVDVAMIVGDGRAVGERLTRSIDRGNHFGAAHDFLLSSKWKVRSTTRNATMSCAVSSTSATEKANGCPSARKRFRNTINS